VSEQAIVPLSQQLDQAVPKDLAPALVHQITETFAPMFTEAEKVLNEAALCEVSDASDLRGMKKARELRLTLKDIRGRAEKSRVLMTADALKSKQTIDMVARTLKNELEQAEEYLEGQEKYAERQQAEREAKVRAERAAQMEALGCDPAPHTNLGSMDDKSWKLLLAACEGEKKLRDEEERKAKEEAQAAERRRQEELAEARRKAEEERKARLEAEAKAHKESEALKAQMLAEQAQRQEEEAKQRAENERLRKEKELADKKAQDAKQAADLERRKAEQAQREADTAKTQVELQRQAEGAKLAKAAAQGSPLRQAMIESFTTIRSLAQAEIPRTRSGSTTNQTLKAIVNEASKHIPAE
jgi:hypothetical protein